MILRLPRSAPLAFPPTKAGDWVSPEFQVFFKGLSVVGTSEKNCLYVGSVEGKWVLSDWPRETCHRYIFSPGVLLRFSSKDCQRNHQGIYFKMRFFSSKMHPDSYGHRQRHSCPRLILSPRQGPALPHLRSPLWFWDVQMLCFLRPPLPYCTPWCLLVFMVLRVEARALGVQKYSTESYVPSPWPPPPEQAHTRNPGSLFSLFTVFIPTSL